MVAVEAGEHAIGAGRWSGFAYDNERARHTVELAAFEIDRTPVDQRRVRSRSWRRPAPSRRCTGSATARAWVRTAMGRPSPSTRPARRPRLLAARPTPSPAGPASACRPSRSGRPPARAWRASARSGSGPPRTSSPTPASRPSPTREYSEVFFGDTYKVLRGGSWATHPSVIRPSFRNWDLPERRQIFAGIRCARNV